jgi:hypothetical protein
MAENIYAQIGKRMGKDVRLVRAAAHHPFEFFSKVMEDPEDHRPVRFRYLGAFYVKPYWRKGLRSTKSIGPPPEDKLLWVRAPEKKFNKIYTNLKQGVITDSVFRSTDGSVECPASEILFWGGLSNYDELSINEY